jgi:hypothetical protein
MRARIGRESVQSKIMENILVRRDQFNITPHGIVHKPTDASFTPYPGEAYCGITRMGQLGNRHPNGSGFKPDDVQRMMRQLWIEYVVGNPKLFKTTELGGADPGATGFDWPPEIQVDGGQAR